MSTKKLYTLEQAHKTGRSFRKEGSLNWINLKDVNNLSGEEAFAKIWEIKERDSFTLSEVERMLNNCIITFNNDLKYLDSLKRAELVQHIINREIG
jgi:hypothetical protein